MWIWAKSKVKRYSCVCQKRMYMFPRSTSQGRPAEALQVRKIITYFSAPDRSWFQILSALKKRHYRLILCTIRTYPLRRMIRRWNRLYSVDFIFSIFGIQPGDVKWGLVLQRPKKSNQTGQKSVLDYQGNGWLLQKRNWSTGRRYDCKTLRNRE